MCKGAACCICANSQRYFSTTCKKFIAIEHQFFRVKILEVKK
jgi:hypothetical protein